MIFNDICNKYKKELLNYNYINCSCDILNLHAKGNIRYINKIDNKLRFGGVLLKTYVKYNNIFLIIKQNPNKIYSISYSNNYIFYRDNKDIKLKNWLKCFITDVDNDKYNIIK